VGQHGLDQGAAHAAGGAKDSYFHHSLSGS
jgi:hypothetical protein